MVKYVDKSYLSHKCRVDMYLSAGHSCLWSFLRYSDWPGWVNSPDLLVQLVQLLVSEDLVPVPPGQPQLVQQPAHLRCLGLILLSQGLKIKPWFTPTDETSKNWSCDWILVTAPGSTFTLITLQYPIQEIVNRTL